MKKLVEAFNRAAAHAGQWTLLLIVVVAGLAGVIVAMLLVDFLRG